MKTIHYKVLAVLITSLFYVVDTASQSIGTSQSSKSLPSSEYHIHKAHLIDSYEKFQFQKEGRIAFLGGSITYNGGWRDSLMIYFKKRFASTKFTFINAGIPSMGSTPAAFRLERDVFSKGPIDLLFEEAAVNDHTNGRSALEQIRAMEGIVRKVWKKNAKTDIVLMHFVDPSKMENYRNGEEPEVIRNHQIVADYYHISEINLAKEVTERIDNGEFSWEDDFINLHPSPFGQRIYARSMIQFLDDAFAKVVEDKKLIDKKWEVSSIDDQSYSNGNLIEIQAATFDGHWQKKEDWNPSDGKGVRANFHSVPMLINEGGEGSLSLKFEGPLIGIAVAAGPDSGTIEYRVDDGLWKSKNLYTRWSARLHLPWYYTLETELSDKEHTVQIRLQKKSNKDEQKTACRIRYFYTNSE